MFYTACTELSLERSSNHQEDEGAQEVSHCGRERRRYVGGGVQAARTKFPGWSAPGKKGLGT